MSAAQRRLQAVTAQPHCLLHKVGTQQCWKSGPPARKRKKKALRVSSWSHQLLEKHTQISYRLMQNKASHNGRVGSTPVKRFARPCSPCGEKIQQQASAGFQIEKSCRHDGDPELAVRALCCPALHAGAGAGPVVGVRSRSSARWATGSDAGPPARGPGVTMKPPACGPGCLCGTGTLLLLRGSLPRLWREL